MDNECQGSNLTIRPLILRGPAPSVAISNHTSHCAPNLSRCHFRSGSLGCGCTSNNGTWVSEYSFIANSSFNGWWRCTVGMPCVDKANPNPSFYRASNCSNKTVAVGEAANNKWRLAYEFRPEEGGGGGGLLLISCTLAESIYMFYHHLVWATGTGIIIWSGQPELASTLSLPLLDLNLRWDSSYWGRSSWDKLSSPYTLFVIRPLMSVACPDVVLPRQLL